MIVRADVRFLCTFAGSEKKQAGFPSRCLRREMTTCEIKVIQTQPQKGYTLYQEHPVMQTLSWQFALFAGETCIFFTARGKISQIRGEGGASGTAHLAQTARSSLSLLVSHSSIRTCPLHTGSLPCISLSIGLSFTSKLSPQHSPICFRHLKPSWTSFDNCHFPSLSG